MTGILGPETVWQLLEQLSNFFYDPKIFWGLPLIVALLWVALFRRYHH